MGRQAERSFSRCLAVDENCLPEGLKAYLATRTLASAPTVGSFARTSGSRLAAAHLELPHSCECAYRRLVRQNEESTGRQAERSFSRCLAMVERLRSR